MVFAFMPSWNADQYLRFAAERTQPAIDLAARIQISAPARLIDLGCGPGNSTEVLARCWPGSDLVGLDSSASMIEAAKRDHPQWHWLTGDIATWSSAEPFDIVFSNAALQWVPDHRACLPKLFRSVARDGALAFQVPANLGAPAHRLMRELGASDRWSSSFRGTVREWHVEEPSVYYDVLAPLAKHVQLWTTEYIHILPDAKAVVEWYRGTGLRPWLDQLPDESSRERFLTEYQELINVAYPSQPDGRVLFPFRRLFVIAYR
jgi:trans-aconitate 2-methyltransferase